MSDLRLTPGAADRIRNEITRAGGREVCFLARVDQGRRVLDPRAVARGNYDAVLVAARSADEGDVMIHNHPSGSLEPSAADLAVAGRLYELGLGTAIVDNDARRLYVVVEPPAPRVVSLLDPGDVGRMVAPGGALSRIHPAYEDRAGQRKMLSLVVERFNEGGVAIVEAGTGTGKSLAYLLPAAAWAVRNGERTVVSTNTINLQEQLVAQDLPLVGRLLRAHQSSAGADRRQEEDGEGESEAGEAATGEAVDWALVKGRGNYVSIRRARLAVEQAASLFDDAPADELGAILHWTEGSEDGSLSDLSFVPSPEVWDEVRSDSDICLRARCPHFQRCFYQRSRRRAASADILVVNHHLLFTDLAVRRATNNFTDTAVLPPYRHLVLDEAHNVEDAATSHLGVELSRVGLMRTLARLDRGGKGVLSAVGDRLRGDPAGGSARELLRRIEERGRPALEEARSRAELFLDAIEPLIPDADGQATRIGTDALPEPGDRPDLRERLDSLLGALARLEREMEELRRRIELDERWHGDLEGRVLDLASVERRLAGAAGALRLVLLPDDEERESHVRWVEMRSAGKRRRTNPVLAAAPVELGPLLRASLFERTDTAILSSATLATRQGFEFFRRRVGLEKDVVGEPGGGRPVVDAMVSTPFDFRTQTLFAVPTDLPGPGSRDEDFDAATAKVVRELAVITGGGIFVLFTSHRALNATARLLAEGGLDARFPLFVHGEESRARLLQGFVDSGRGILLGTASFWEGVDVPGRPLRALILQKLPFRVPTEPVTAARLEAVEREGLNPFWDYMLPLAALRLKQGFGRLIRSRSDRGAVLLLDDRIVRRRYGRYLRDSLPDAPFRKGSWIDVRRTLRRFYAVPPPS